jgi:hypothetical protein
MLQRTRHLVSNPGLDAAVLLVAFIGVMAIAWW